MKGFKLLTITILFLFTFNLVFTSIPVKAIENMESTQQEVDKNNIELEEKNKENQETSDALEEENKEQPTITKLQRDYNNVIVNWTGCGGTGQFEVKINEEIYEVDGYEFIYPIQTENIVSIREKVGTGYSKWSEEKELLTEYSEKKESKNFLSRLIDGNTRNGWSYPSKLVLQTYTNKDGKNQWVENEQYADDPLFTNYIGGKTQNIQLIKLKFREANASINVKYQVYIAENAAWQDIKKNGEEAGEIGKTITNIRVWVDDPKYDVRYSVTSSTSDENAFISSWVNNGEEVSKENTNKKPISMIAVELYEKTHKLDVNIMVNDDGEKKWINNVNGDFYSYKNLSINKIKINLKENPKNLKLSYQVYINEDRSWQDLKIEGEEAGLEDKTIGDIRIKVEGDTNYIIRYNTSFVNAEGVQEKSKFKINGSEIFDIKKDKVINGIFMEIYSGNPKLKMMSYSKNSSNYSEWKFANHWIIPDRYGIDSEQVKKFKIDCTNKPIGIDLNYKVRIRNSSQPNTVGNWQSWNKNSEIAGDANYDITSIIFKFEENDLNLKVKYGTDKSTVIGNNGEEITSLITNNKSINQFDIFIYNSDNISNLNINVNPIIVDNIYEIPEGVNIIIPEGKEIVFSTSKSQKVGFDIKGSLTFKGSANSKIKISDPNGVGQIKVSKSGNLKMDYVQASIGKLSQYAQFIKGEGIQYITNSSFIGPISHGGSTAINIESLNETIITGTEIKGWSTGIEVVGEYKGKVKVESNTISQCGSGISVYDRANTTTENAIDLLNNTNINDNYIGIIIVRHGTTENNIHRKINVIGNKISGSRQSGIRLDAIKFDNLVIQKNIIKETLPNDLEVEKVDFWTTRLGGGPIYINLSNIKDTTEVSSNFIKELNTNDSSKCNVIENGNNIDGIVIYGRINTNIRIPNGKYNYVVDNYIIINEGKTLLIDEGVKLNVIGRLWINGELNLSGAKGNPITIAYINDTTHGVSNKLKYKDIDIGFLIFSYGGKFNATNTRIYNGSELVKQPSPTTIAIGKKSVAIVNDLEIDNKSCEDKIGILVSGSQLEMTSSKISNSYMGILNFSVSNIVKSRFDSNATGISISDEGETTISSCIISNSRWAGISNNGKLQLISSVISNNSDGIRISSEKPSLIYNNSIKGNKTGIDVGKNTNIEIVQNDIVANERYGIYSYFTDIYANNNYWGHPEGPSMWEPYVTRGDWINKRVKVESIFDKPVSGQDIGVDDNKYSDDVYKMLEDYNYNLRKQLNQNGAVPSAGNFSISYSDLVVTSNWIDYTFSRQYSSRNDKTGILGLGWSLYYESNLSDTKTSDNAVIGKTVTLPGGIVCSFQKKTDGTFEALDTRNKLTVSGSEFKVTTNENIEYKFDKDGKLITISDKYNNELNIKYTDGKISIITDGCGRKYEFKYNNNLLDSIQEVIDGVNKRKITYKYVNGQLQSVIDVNGNIQDIFEYYEGNKKLKKITKNDEIINDITYYEDSENKGKIKTIKDERDNTKTYTYFNDQRKVEIKDSNNKKETVVYDKNLFITAVIDNEDNSIVYNYLLDKKNNNLLGEQKSLKDKNNNVTEFIRDKNGNISVEVLPNNSHKQFQYDSKNNLIKEINEDGIITYYKYDKTGVYLLEKAIPLNGSDDYYIEEDKNKFAITRYEYYQVNEGNSKIKGKLKAEYKPEGGKITYEYNSKGFIEKLIDEESNITNYQYDDYGNQSKVSVENRGVIEKVYDKKGNLETVIDGEKNKTSYVYDKLDRLSNIIKPKEQGKVDKDNKPIYTATYQYNKAGEKVQETDLYNNTLEYCYNKYGDLESEKNGQGAIYIYEYDVAGRKTKTFYKENESATKELLEESIYELENEQSNGIYRLVEKKKEYISPEQYNTTIIKYDHKINIVEKLQADNTTQKNIYYPSGKLKCFIDESNMTTLYEYNIFGKLSKSYEPYDIVNENIIYKYKEFNYNKNGELIQEKVGKDFVNYDQMPKEYFVKDYILDKKGRVLTERDNENRRTDYTYNESSSIDTKKEYLDNNNYVKNEYVYDGNEKVKSEKTIVKKDDIIETQLTDIEKNNSNDYFIVETLYDYDENGNEKKITYPSGEYEERYYDSLDRAVNIKQFILNSKDKLELFEENYQYLKNSDKVKVFTNNEGKNYVYDYYNNLNLKQIDFGDDSYERYEYSLLGTLQAKTICKNNTPEFNVTIYDYDSMKRVVTESLVGYRGKQFKVAYKYDNKGNLSKKVEGNQLDKALGGTISEKIENAKGNINTYYLNNKLKTVLKPDAQLEKKDYSIKYEYDTLGNVIKEYDANENFYEYKLNSVGQLLEKSVYNKNKDTKKILGINEYDSMGNIIKTTDGEGNFKTYIYNSFNKIKQINFPGDESIEKETIKIKYYRNLDSSETESTNGRMSIQIKNINDNVVEDTITDKNKSEKITEYYDYNGDKKVKIFVDGEGNITNFKYDNRGREIEKLINSKVINQKTYTISNLIKSEKDKFGNETIYTFDTFGNYEYKIDPNGNYVEKYEHDNNNKLKSVTDLNMGLKSTYNYDDNERLVSVSGTLNEKLRYVYDLNDNIIEKEDDTGIILKYEFDELKRIEYVTNALNEKIAYSYDNNNNLISQKDAKNNTTTYKFNVANKLYKVTAPNNGNLEGKVQQYLYYADGTIKAFRDRNNNIINYSYDIFGRKKSETVSNKSIEYKYFNNHMLKEVIDPQGVTKFTYDGEGRTKTKEVVGLGKVTYNYDDVSEVKLGYHSESIQDDLGNKNIKYYDKNNRLIAVNDGTNQVNYEYNNNGKLRAVNLPNGMSQTYGYRNDGELRNIIINKDNSQIGEYLYSYDENGNIIRSTDGEKTESYQYDKLGRIEKVSTSEFHWRDAQGLNPTIHNGEIYKTVEYGYDKAGNREFEKVNLNKKLQESKYQYDNENRLENINIIADNINTTIDYDYDNNGNQIAKLTKDNISNKVLDEVNQVFDEYNQLVEVNNGKSIIQQSAYNYEGLRISKTVNGEVTKFLYDNKNIVLEVNNLGKQVARNVYGNTILSRTVGDQKGYYINNIHSDVTSIYGQNKQLLANYSYDIFGNIEKENSNFNNPYKYAGYYYDSETKNYYLESRMYNPYSGRFLQSDKFLGNQQEPLSLNLYSYCHNNPLLYSDPNGHWIHIAAGAIIGGLVSTATNAVFDYLDDGKINRGWKSYAGSFAEGAVTGGLAAATGGASLLVKYGINVLGNAVNQKVTSGKVNWTESLISGGVDLAIDGAGSYLWKNAKKYIPKVLKSSSDIPTPKLVKNPEIKLNSQKLNTTPNNVNLNKNVNIATNLNNKINNNISKTLKDTNYNIINLEKSSSNKKLQMMDLQLFANKKGAGNPIRTTSDNSRELSRNLAREGRAVGSGEAAAHIVASTGSKRQWSIAADSRNLLDRYGININDAANGIPLGHPRPHNITHTGDFHTMVNGRLHDVVDNMKYLGYGRKAIRSSLRKELRKIGNEILD